MNCRPAPRILTLMPVKGLAALNLPAQQRWRRSSIAMRAHRRPAVDFDADTVFTTITL